MKLPISIVIPAYNNKALLKGLLGSIDRFASVVETIVVDDGSTDGTAKWLSTHYPDVICLELPKNQGFGRAVNHGFRAATADYVLLLNSDTRLLNSKSLKNLVAALEADPKLFAVGATEELPDGSRRGRAVGRVEKGVLVHGPGDSTESGPTLWVFGASGLFRRQVFLELGGMSQAYYPAYFEDIELSWRAWKAGWRCWFLADAAIAHDESTTMSRHLKHKIFLSLKNQLLFSMTSLTDWQHRVSLWLWLPYHLTVSTIRTRGMWPIALIAAMLKIVTVPHPDSIKLTDKQVFERLS